jgi:hypothetical protein
METSVNDNYGNMNFDKEVYTNRIIQKGMKSTEAKLVTICEIQCSHGDENDDVVLGFDAV